MKTRRRRPVQREAGSLLIVGVGIGGPSQTTFEAAAAMAKADTVLYLVTDPTAELWIRSLNKSTESLKHFYREGLRRRVTYRRISDRIVESVRSGLKVCAVFYGHPGLLVDPSHDAARRLKRTGHVVRMLPAVSADGCLYADLGVNPGIGGAQNFEATDFLLWRRVFDPEGHLLLWQIGVLGEATTRRSGASDLAARLRVLVKRLTVFYPPTHGVVVYRAATFAGTEPAIQRLALSRLPQAQIAPISTLYVPPVRRRRAPDSRVAGWLRLR